MSWMRSPIYCWGDGRRVHVWARAETSARVMDPTHYEGFLGGVSMKESTFDALCLYRAAELMNEPKALRRAVKKAKKLSGNFGSFAFLEALGEDPEAEFAARMAAVTASRNVARPDPAPHSTEAHV